MLNFNIILNCIIKDDLNNLIRYLYSHIAYIIKMINIYDNPQITKKFDVFSSVFYYALNGISNEDIYFIPVLITKLVKYIIKKKSIMKLNGLDEINYFNQPKYLINIADRDIYLQLFVLDIVFYYFKSIHKYKKKLKYYVGIDFEFNNQQIALCQICLFSINKQNTIWIFDPKELNNIQKKYLIDYIYIPKNIYKIFHGSESLDIPYLFNIFFDNDTNIIFKFINGFIDTRFICEYYKNYIHYVNNKCSIYDALLFFNVISLHKYNELNNITTKMGKVYQITWNVHNMNHYNTIYALYDVLFLKDYLFKMSILFKKNPWTFGLIKEYTRFVILEKWCSKDNHYESKYNIPKVSSAIPKSSFAILNQLKNETDNINNYFVNNNDSSKLIDIYNSYISHEKNHFVETRHHLRYVSNTDNVIVIIHSLLDINYFKSSLNILLKYTLYSYITNNCVVYKKKDMIYNDKLDVTLISMHLRKIKMNRIIQLLDKFIEFVKINQF